MRLASIGSYAASLALFAGCTAVLGIHKAELDDAGSAAWAGAGPSTGMGSSTGTGSPGSKTRCARTAVGCSACLASKCSAAMNACLGDSECRRSMDTYSSSYSNSSTYIKSYTVCIDTDCTDEGNSCAEAAPGLAQDLMGCMLDNCSANCSSGGLISLCELYCSCMQSLCEPDFSATLGGTKEKCIAACSSLGERDKSCRWSHCEYARVSASTHCPHAIAAPIDFCNEVAPPQRHAPCLDRQETGFPCDKDSDCCSSTCLGGAICK